MNALLLSLFLSQASSGGVSPSRTFASRVASGGTAFSLLQGAKLRFGAVGGAELAYDGTSLTLNKPLSSSVASGGNAFAMQAGAKVCFDSSCLRFIHNWQSDHLLVSAGRFYTPNVWGASTTTAYVARPTNNGTAVAHSFQTEGALTTAGALLGQFVNQSTVKLKVDRNGSLQQVPQTLETCSSANEGLVTTDVAAGASTGARTRRCMCTSDGGGTPAYAWQNIVSGTVGTTTTCSP